MATKKKRPRCSAKTKRGTRCRAAPLKGTKRCSAHPLEPDSARFGSPEQAREAGLQGGRPRLPRPHEVLRERIENDIERWLAPLEAALGAGKPVVVWDGQERQHHIEFVEDPKLGMQAMKLAFDRVYGRPRQSVEISGSDGGPVRMAAAFDDPELREELHGLVRRVADARAS
jgi:hypothetical protein